MNAVFRRQGQRMQKNACIIKMNPAWKLWVENFTVGLSVNQGIKPDVGTARATLHNHGSVTAHEKKILVGLP